jgi:hypothetical protein
MHVNVANGQHEGETNEEKMIRDNLQNYLSRAD